MTKIPSLADMLKVGAHFGHSQSRWHPKMAAYLFGARNGFHVIDLEKTQVELERSLAYLQAAAAKGKTILFVGTKRQARAHIKAAAEACEMPYLTERWIGGLLTNFEEVKRRLKKYRTLKDQVQTGEIEKYTKKEQVRFKKDLDKMDRYLLGLVKLDRLPDIMYIADMRTEKTALAEANRMAVPVVGVCDSNVNPENAQYIIPANDDAVGSIKMVADLVAEAINEGKVEWEKVKLAQAKEAATAKAAADKIATEKAVAAAMTREAEAKKSASAKKDAAVAKSPKTETRAMKVTESV